MDVDVLVVGAGPVGSETARRLAVAGWSVLLLEEHSEVGRPVQCAGLVTPRVFDMLPFPIGDLWENDLSGAEVHSPDGTVVAFDAGRVHAQAMDRARFDQRVAGHAVRAGVDLHTGAKVVGMRHVASGVEAIVQDDGRGTVTARMLIGADGVRSRVAHWTGLPPVRETVSAYEVELSGARIPAGREHVIPMFAGHARAPGFFSWIIPVGGDRVRAGLAVAPGMSTAAAKQYYERMFQDPASAAYLDGAEPVYPIVGGIPLGLRRRLVADRVAVVGDAAGMAKPTSGGGIYTGLVGAGHLAATVDRCLRRDRLSRGDLLPYERAVRRTIAKELRRGERLRSLYTRLSDQDFDRLAHLLATPRARQVIEAHGDIDYPSRLVWPLLRAQPRLAPLFAAALLRGVAP